MFDSLADLPDAGATAALLAAEHRARVSAECRLVELAAHWADLHSGLPEPDGREVCGQRHRVPGGDGTPAVLEFAAAELGALLETTTGAAWELMADALDLRHRLPRLWAAVLAGRVRLWKARKVARETRRVSVDAAARVDLAVDGLIEAVSWARFEAVLAAKIAEADPAGEEARAAAYEAERFVRSGRTSESGLKLLIARASAGDVIWFMATVERIAEILGAEGNADPIDVRRSLAIGILARPDRALALLRRHAVAPERDGAPDPEADGHVSLGSGEGLAVDLGASRPRVELVVHISAEALGAGAGPARLEGVGPLLAGQIRRWLAGSDCAVLLRPVVDLRAELAPVDAYEIPRTMRRFLSLRSPASVFPYSGAGPSVTGPGLDLDHTAPYVAMECGGPPGQTAVGNLGPLSRSEHRLKTHSPWQARQPEAGTFVWRSPNGYHWITTPHAGTYALGCGRFAAAIWCAVSTEAVDLAA
jgi:Domain of unknown function (DUF222)